MKRIALMLGVSQSSVSVWTRDVRLSPDVAAAKQRRSGKERGAAWRNQWRERRREYQEEGRARARDAEPLHAIGCMLYWAEGSKSRNSVVFSNSDPAMMEMFTRFLRGCFGMTSEDFTFRLNVYTNNGLSIDEIELFWMHRLGLSRRCARKHMLNHFPTSSSGRRGKKLPYGVCTLRVNRSTRIVHHIYGAIQEYSGIDQPAWLDGPERRRAA